MQEQSADSTMSLEQRRSLVYQKLKAGTGEKMTANRSRAARETLSEAWALASIEPRITGPLYEACAYRMANVMFRSADSREQLLAVDRFYQLAIADDPTLLGPMPLIQRVAVLYRLAALPGAAASEKKQLDSVLQEAYAMACQAVRAPTPARTRGTFNGAGIQGNLHNLMELTAYYTGYAYEDHVEGLASPFEDLALGDEWMIFGTGSVDERVRLPYELARVELQQRKQRGLQMAFELPGGHKRGGFPVWTPTRLDLRGGRRPLLMLAALCSKPCTDRDLGREVFPDASPGDAALRDIRRELRELLQDALGEPGLSLLPKAEPGQPHTLRSDLRIAGMVAVDACRPRRGA